MRLKTGLRGYIIINLALASFKDCAYAGVELGLVGVNQKSPISSILISKAGRLPFEGVWGSNAKACRSREGVDRMTIVADEFQWYETHCSRKSIKREDARSWTMRLSCEGEGEKIESRPRLTMPTVNTLIMDDGPIGPSKRQRYVRCGGR